MLGKTAAGLFWMFRYFERSENTARLIDTGFRISLTRSNTEQDEWASILSSTSTLEAYHELHDQIETDLVIDFLLREPTNPSSVMSMIHSARLNARLVRTALTREVWEATNECWMILKETLKHKIPDKRLPEVLRTIRQSNALIKGAMHGTMLRNDMYDFARIGTFLERADNTARILDVKYFVLLPSPGYVGSSIDNVQWESILLSVSGRSGYTWLYEGDVNPVSIANFLILEQQMPRSLAFCYNKITDNLTYLEGNYSKDFPSKLEACEMYNNLKSQKVEDIFETGLHEFIQNFIAQNQKISNRIEQDFRFYK